MQLSEGCRGSRFAKRAKCISLLGACLALHDGCTSTSRLLAKGDYEAAAKRCESDTGEDARECYGQVADVAYDYGALDFAIECYEKAGHSGGRNRRTAFIKQAELRFGVGKYPEGEALLLRGGISELDALRLGAKWCLDHPNEKCAPKAVELLRKTGLDEPQALAEVGAAVFKHGLMSGQTQLQELGQEYLQRGGRANEAWQIRVSLVTDSLRNAQDLLARSNAVEQAYLAHRAELDADDNNEQEAKRAARLREATEGKVQLTRRVDVNPYTGVPVGSSKLLEDEQGQEYVENCKVLSYGPLAGSEYDCTKKAVEKPVDPARTRAVEMVRREQKAFVEAREKAIDMLRRADDICAEFPSRLRTCSEVHALMKKMSLPSKMTRSRGDTGADTDTKPGDTLVNEPPPASSALPAMPLQDDAGIPVERPSSGP
jgi:hypothetical protein